MKICTIDLETSIKNRGEDAVGGSKASPHCEDNHVVHTGWLDYTGTYCYAAGTYHPGFISVGPNFLLSAGCFLMEDMEKGLCGRGVRKN